MDLTGKTALITGAGRGIGQAIALSLAERNANITLVDRDQDALTSAMESLGTLNARCQPIAADVTDRQQVDGFFAEAVEHFGRVDFCFSNAGVIKVQKFLDIDETSFDRIMAVNTKGVFLCGQTAARHMVERGGGRIINTASLAARMGIADMAAYCASKAAVMSLTRSMALALAEHNVTVNALAPGIVDTDMWTQIDGERSALHDQRHGEPTRQRVAAIPLGRSAMPADVAAMAEFLVGPGADYITGQTFNIDGGACPS